MTPRSKLSNNNYLFESESSQIKNGLLFVVLFENLCKLIIMNVSKTAAILKTFSDGYLSSLMPGQFNTHTLNLTISRNYLELEPI